MASDLTNGDIVWALSQTGGHGKEGRSWHSPRGGLWFSIIFKPRTLPKDPNIYTKLASVAIVRVLKRAGVKGVGVKWPNDVYHGKMKLGGILTEITSRGTNHSVVVGIGLNVNNRLPETLDKAVSLREVSETNFSVSHLLNSIAREIVRLYDLVTTGKTNVVTNLWRNSMVIKKGMKVRVTRNDGSSYIATVRSILADSLVIENDDGKKRVKPSELEML